MLYHARHLECFFIKVNVPKKKAAFRVRPFENEKRIDMKLVNIYKKIWPELKAQASYTLNAYANI